MQDLLNAIQTLAVHDWVDYCAVFAPMILSAVAVIISIYTARKQNKIDLFNVRYDAYREAMKLEYLREEMAYYLECHPGIPDSTFALNHFIEEAMRVFRAQNDYELLRTLHLNQFIYRDKLSMLFPRIDFSNYIKDLEELTAFFEKRYDENEFDLVSNYVELDNELIKWVNKKYPAFEQMKVTMQP